MKFILSTLLIGLSFAAHAAPLASGKLTLAAPLAEKAKGIRTLFISITDAKSGRPMPYAAQKIDLPKDASGEFHAFALTPETLMVMGGGDAPELMNLKAKLDKDGGAGPDSAGDIVGVLKNVKKGAMNLKIVLDKAVD